MEGLNAHQIARIERIRAKRKTIQLKCEQCDCEDIKKLASYWWIEAKNEKWTLCEDCGIAEEQDKCDEP